MHASGQWTRAAFADLYDQYARAVYNHALRLTGSWSEAEEAMSETFLAAWRTRETVEPEGGSLKPWLLGIATHKAHNINRGQRRRLAVRCAPSESAATIPGAFADQHDHRLRAHRGRARTGTPGATAVHPLPPGCTV